MLDDIQEDRAQGKYTGRMGTESRLLMALHRQCLCHHCAKFKPNPDGREENCEIANKLYDLCVEYDLVTPVARCPQFVQREG